jgi:hypothetical protein
MKARNLVIAVVILVIALTVIFVVRAFSPGRAAKKAVAARQEKGKAAATVPDKKTFQKGMGGLSVKAKNSKGSDMSLRVKAFRSDGSSSSVFVSAFASARMQELSPGTYDIELDTVPAKIFKDIKVSDGKETVEDLGALTGAINVKALNSKKKEMYVLFRTTYPKSNLLVATATTNRPLETIPGVYNVEIETLPRQVKNDVKVEGGKETIVDLGIVSGALNIKAADDNGKDVRLPARIRNASTNTVVASGMTNNPIEVTPGAYDIEVMSMPPQAKKAIKVAAGEDTDVTFVVNPPAPPPVKTPPSPVKAPAKKK